MEERALLATWLPTIKSGGLWVSVWLGWAQPVRVPILGAQDRA